MTGRGGKTGKKVAKKVAKKAVPKPAATDVESVLTAAEHPLRAEIDLVREWTRTAAPGIEEGVKWNAPSFRTAEWFATIHLRTQDQVQVVLHLGAKSTAAVAKAAIPDPAGLLQWLGAGRAMASLGAGATLRKRRAAWQRIVAAWLGCAGS